MTDFKFQQTDLGWSYKTRSHHYFFGNKNSSVENFVSYFSNYQFRTINQIHSDITVQANSQVQTADAHYTQVPFEALCIRTADCVPILIHDNKTSLALHAGWRGLASSIISKALQVAQLDLEQTQVFIGPHIHKESFEVGLNVATQLTSTLSDEFQKTFILPHSDPQKVFIDLEGITRQQIQSYGIKPSAISTASKCTFTSPDLHSFRRDVERSGRQFSFIVKLTI